MSSRFILAPEAAHDLAQIWLRIEEDKNADIADRVERVILDRIAFLARTPGAGHTRRDLTDAPVKFFPVYSYLIVYRPETRPLQVVSILHGHRDAKKILKQRI